MLACAPAALRNRVRVVRRTGRGAAARRRRRVPFAIAPNPTTTHTVISMLNRALCCGLLLFADGALAAPQPPPTAPRPDVSRRFAPDSESASVHAAPPTTSTRRATQVVETEQVLGECVITPLNFQRPSSAPPPDMMPLPAAVSHQHESYNTIW